MNYGAETNGRVPRLWGSDRADKRASRRPVKTYVVSVAIAVQGLWRQKNSLLTSVGNAVMYERETLCEMVGWRRSDETSQDAIFTELSGR